MAAAPPPSLSELCAQYLSAQLRGDRREALRLVMVDGLANGASFADLTEDVIGAAQREIGIRWQRSEIGIAEEHMATAISNLVLAQLYEHAPPAAPNGRSVLVACVEGELHELPARLVADALDMAGFSVRYLGASVPSRSLVSMIQRDRPDLVALSATMSFHANMLRATVREIRALGGAAPPIAVGGGALAWSRNLASELAADVTATRASELVERARRLLGVGP